jgi:ubiquinone/menaquinone biosynthesis C-methylase UbiE
MSYFSLDRRVPEVSALDPKALTWLYSFFARAPFARTMHRGFVAGALSQDVAEGTALDLGTGPGHAAVAIARRRPAMRMIGLDLAVHMVDRASRQAARAGLDGRGMWPQADGHHLPFGDGSFDLVVSSFAMHHWRDPLRILNEIARVLKPDGRYYIVDVCRKVTLAQRLLAYASIPVISLPFGSYLAYGGYYESVRAAYTLPEARSLLHRSALPPGEVRPASTWLVPVLVIASKRAGEG